MKEFTYLIDNFLRFKNPDKYFQNLNHGEIRRTRIVNYIGIISIMNMMLFVGIYSILDFKLFLPAINFLSISSIGIVGIIYLNLRGFFYLAKILISIANPFSMTYSIGFIVGTEADFQVYLLLSTIIPIFIWSFKQKWYLIFFVCINLVLYILLEFYPILFSNQITLPSNYLEFFQKSSVIICFLSLGAAVAIMHYYYSVQEKILIKQTKELRITQEHKDKVYSIIAHDLRSPLSSFVGLTELYLQNYDSYDENKRKEIISVMFNSSSEVHSLLENLLDWSKMQAGVLKETYTNFNLKECAEDSIKINKNQIENKSIIVTVDIDSSILVYSDKYMVSTVFRNLISNAIKFSSENGRIDISSITIGSEVEICISDTGEGIREADMEKIFKLNSSLSNMPDVVNYKGGLGLHLCKEFVDLNNGKIWVESVLGEGSKFYFTLKLSV
jgi:signal transduction histidine kinase